MAHVEFAHICPLQTSKQKKTKFPPQIDQIKMLRRCKPRLVCKLVPQIVFLRLILMLGKGAPIITAMYNIMHL